MAAVADASARSKGGRPADGGDPALQDAQHVAELITNSVQLSVSVSESMQLQENEEGADSVRLALAALVSPCVAEYYQHHGQAPAEKDLGKIAKSFQTVLTFSENFSQIPGHIQRLQALGPDLAAHDENQLILCHLKAALPIVKAVNGFSFGQNETILLQEIVSRLTQRAQSLYQELCEEKVGSVDVGQKQYYELMVFVALAQLYSDAHLAETQRLSTIQDSEGAASIDTVWSSFDTKLAMLVAVLRAGVPGLSQATQVQAQSSGGGPAQAPPPVPPVEPPVSGAPPPPTAPIAPSATSPTTEPAAASGGGGPMGFFKPGAQTPAEAPAQVPPQSAPVASATPQQPTAAAPESLPESPQAPPASPPQTSTPASTDNPAQNPVDNPMGFFKGGDKKETDDQ